MSNGMENHPLNKTPKSSDAKKKLVINHRFEVRECRQETTSSKLYTGFDLLTKTEVIVKFIRADKVRSQFQANYSLLGQDCVPKLLWEEVIDDIQVFVYELQGKDLQSLFNKAQGKFSFITVSMIFHLIILALEKLHSKEIVHTNLKPSKILIDRETGDTRFYLTGLEMCEKITNSKLNRSRSGTPRKKRTNENIFSSLSIHAGESIGYKDDLESLSYIIINFFTHGKFFKKVAALTSLTKKSREVLVGLKSNVLSEILLSGIPLEIFDFIKYISKLKVNEMPNYEYLKGLSLKLCQRFYMKKDVISVLDWVQVPLEEQNFYRSKMLSYFFCMSIPQIKKKVNKIDEISLSLKRKSSQKTLNSSGYLMKSFQGFPIHEIPGESAENSKILPDFITAQNNEEYQAAPPTARLTLLNKAYITESCTNLRLVTQSEFYDPNSLSLEDSFSPKSRQHMDSLDDIDSSDDEGINDHNMGILQNNVKAPSMIGTEHDLNRTGAESGKSKTSTHRLPPSVMRPEPMKYKMMPR